MDKQERKRERKRRQYVNWQYTQLFRGLLALPFWARFKIAMKLMFRG